MNYRYCLFNRPLGIGAQPKGVVATEPRPVKGDDWYEIARHGFALYDRKLSYEEEKSFELAPVLNPEDLDDLAAKVACDYREHRSAIVMMNGEDKAWVRTAFFEKGRRLYPGYHPALPDNFPDLVYGKLMESVSNG